METVPQNRSRIIARYVCNFKTRGERRVKKGDMRIGLRIMMWRE